MAQANDIVTVLIGLLILPVDARWIPLAMLEATDPEVEAIIRILTPSDKASPAKAGLIVLRQAILHSEALVNVQRVADHHVLDR